MDTRKNRILHAVIKEYVSTAVPVGSKTLCDNYDLDCSPATVRSELSALEELGYLTHPHTSAGRVPTDKGYRLFVDNVIAMREAFSVGKGLQFIDKEMLRSLDVRDVMRGVSKALSAYTQCLALSRTPSLDNITVKKLELLSLSDQRMLFVLMTGTGQVLNRTLELTQTATPEDIAAVQHSLNVALDGKPAREIRPLRDALITKDHENPNPSDDLMLRVLDEIIDSLSEADHERVRHGGIAALLAQPEFADTTRAQPLVDMLEGGLDILELINIAESPHSNSLHVRIGNENSLSAFGDTSLIISSYQCGGGLGFIGVVGPTRMNYIRSIKAVSQAARELSETLDESANSQEVNG